MANQKMIKTHPWSINKQTISPSSTAVPSCCDIIDCHVGFDRYDSDKPRPVHGR